MSGKNSNRKLTAEQIEAELRRVRGAGKLKKTGTDITTEQLKAELKRVRGIKDSKVSKAKSESTVSEKPENKKGAERIGASGTSDAPKKTEELKTENKPEEVVNKKTEVQNTSEISELQKEIDALFSEAKAQNEKKAKKSKGSDKHKKSKEHKKADTLKNESESRATPPGASEIAERQREIDALFSAAQLEMELKRTKQKKEKKRLLRDAIIVLLGVAAAAVLVAVLFLPVLRVTGSSMEQTLYSNDIVLCQKGTDFERGEIIAFHFNNKILLKRVIGISGDVIDITDDGHVTVNGVQLDEPYVTNFSKGKECDIEFPYQVPDKRTFIMGDNRPTSIDSRSSTIGCIADEYIVGKVILRVWPMERFGTVK